MTAGNGSVRQVLADATHKEHITLHGNPWIGAFASPDLTRSHYQVILGAYRAFFALAERERRLQGRFSDLSLAKPITALDQDLGQCVSLARAEPRLPLDCTATPAALLGLLYVLHGSGFGARVLGKNVGKVLPGVPCYFLSTGTPRALWRNLVAELENLRNDQTGQQQAIASAKATFNTFGRFVTAFCEAASTQSAEKLPFVAST